MLLVKQSNYNPMDKNSANYISGADLDLTNLFQAFHGRVRFGDGNNGSDGENVSGQWVKFTSSATPNAENAVKHTIGAIPVGFIVVNKDKAGDLYAGTTKWTSSTIYLKGTVASVTYLLFLIK